MIGYAMWAVTRAIGIELKPSYYRQAVKNCEQAGNEATQTALELLTDE